MFGRVFGALRRKPVAFIALFFALSGSRLAATQYITRSEKITQGDLDGSTYGNPVIARKAVTNAKLANSSLSVNADGSTLSGGSKIALGGSNGPPLGVADGGIGTSQLAHGAVTTGKFASDAQTPDSAKLAGVSPSGYGAVLSARVTQPTTHLNDVDYGAASGYSIARSSQSDISTLSPDHALVARYLSVRLDKPPGQAVSFRVFAVVVNGTATPSLLRGKGCEFDLHEQDQHGRDPANSTLSIGDRVGGTGSDVGDAQCGFRLTNP